MKVFMCTRQAGYSGGLAVVAANSVEEAFEDGFKAAVELYKQKQ